MGLETGTFIEDLVATNPLNTDGKSQGDDHMRLIKSVLQNQFPNLGAEALTPTAAELNAIVDNNAAVPAGVITMWFGTIATIPTGWVLCDGNNGTPDLDGLFVSATTDEGQIGVEGGTLLHTHTAQSHTLLDSEVPAHHHNTIALGAGVTTPTSGNQIAIEVEVGPLDSLVDYRLEANTATATVGRSSSSGGDGSHTHTIDGAANVPPFHKLAFIMKT